MADIPLPQVAPHDACIGCLKGDTTTKITFHATPLRIAQCLTFYGFMPKGQAIAFVAWAFEDLSDDEFDQDAQYFPALVCPDCADAARLVLGTTYGYDEE